MIYMTPMIDFSLGGLFVLAIMLVICCMAYVQGYHAGWNEVCGRLGAKVKPQMPHWLDEKMEPATREQQPVTEDAFYA